MNIIQLFQDFGVDYRTEGTKHNRPGWVNVACPFCSGNPGYHLGYCIDSNSAFFKKFVCWRCGGGKKTWETLSKILKINDEIQIKAIWSLYGGKRTAKVYAKPSNRRDIKRQAILPKNTKELASVKGACAYLHKRGFDWKELVETWGILATGPGALLHLESGKVLDFSYRIIIPVRLHGKLGTYQARDWTGKQNPKYLACPPEKEAVAIKKTLYGLDEAEGMEEVFLTEGVTDVWRMGAGWLSLFGAKYTKTQVREIARRFRKASIVLDPDEAGKINARKLASDLMENLMEVQIVNLRDKDVADSSKEQILKILKGK